MKGMTKKLLSLLLCATLLLSCGVTNVFAAKETVLFADDFSGLTAGEKPVYEPGAARWTGASASAGIAYMEGAEFEKNMVLKFINVESNTKNGYPTIKKDIDATGMKDLTVSLRVYGEGRFRINVLTDNETNFYVQPKKGDGWTDISLTIDFEKLTYTLTDANGKGEAKAIPNEIYDIRAISVQLQNILAPGKFGYIDDVAFTTSSANIDIAKANNGTVGVAVKTAASRKALKTESKPTPATPLAGGTIYINDDASKGEQGAVVNGDNSGWTKQTTAALAKFAYGMHGDNPVYIVDSTSTSKHYPTLKLIPNASDLKKVLIQYSVIPCTSSTAIVITSDNDKSTSIASVTKSNDWNAVSVELDLTTSQYTAKINGVESSGTIHKIDDVKTVNITLQSITQAGDTTYWDNILIQSPDVIVSKPVLNKDGSVNIENIQVTKDNWVMKNLKQHPRIHINNWDEMKAKVASDIKMQEWHKRVLSDAEALLTQPVVEWANMPTGTNLSNARNLMARAYILGYAFKMTDDIRFKNKLVEELFEAGRQDDWTTRSFLGNAELNHAFAVAYDWLYYDFTDDEKATILRDWFKGGIGEYVKNYEGNKTNIAFTYVTYNWNPVCNGAAMIAAVALADEYPDVAEYMLDKATTHIKKALDEYNPQGGFNEGTQYWGYAARYLGYAMSSLRSAVKDGYELAPEYRFWEYPGVKETIEFPLYLNTNAGSFNYGDSDAKNKANNELLHLWANIYDWDMPGWFGMKYERERGKYTGMDAVLALSWYNGEGYTYDHSEFPLDKSYGQDNFSAVAMRSSWEDPDALFIGLEGAMPATNHMNYSAGTFMVESDGVVWATMRGYGSSADAAVNYAGRAEGQNTVVLNPNEGAGQSHRVLAPLYKADSSENGGYGIIDMTPMDAGYKKALRGVMMTEDRTRVLLQDEFTTKQPSEWWWFMHTAAKATLSADRKSVLLEDEKMGARMWMHIYGGPEEAKFMLMDAQPLPTSPNPNTQIINYGTKIAIHLENVTEAKVGVEFLPLKAGEAPYSDTTLIPMDNWSVNKSEGQTLERKMGTATALKLDSPVAFAKGRRTYVDVANYDVVPFTENGRTLVPVRFIAENFGATVGWDDATQAVTVNLDGNNIALQIGSNQMVVNGAAQTLDVPAQTYNSRTLIPLRALVEALGKSVFWDDRGLIIISDKEKAWDAVQVNSLIEMLGSRVYVNGAEFTAFTTEDTHYCLQDATSVTAVGLDGASVNAADNGEAFVLTMNGKQYTFEKGTNEFAGSVLASASTQAPVSVVLKNNVGTADGKEKRIYVADVTMNGGETYGKTGTIDKDLSTRWSANIGDSWLCFDFGEVQNVQAMSFAGMNGTSRQSVFDVYASVDGANFTLVKEGLRNSGTTDMPEILELGSVQARYIKLCGHGYVSGTNQGAWNSWTEVAFYPTIADAQAESELWGSWFSAGGISGKVGSTHKVSVTGTNSANLETAFPAGTTFYYYVVDGTKASVSQDGTITLLAQGETRVGVRVSMYGGAVERYAFMNILVE